MILSMFLGTTESIKMKKRTKGIVILDFDGSISQDGVGFETRMLQSLPDLITADSPDVYVNPPMVVQTPKGFHVICYSENLPLFGYTRPGFTNLGFPCEYITSNWCSLIGNNYRLISAIKSDVPLVALIPTALSVKRGTHKGKSDAEFKLAHRIVPVHSRFNTIASLLENGFLVSKNGFLVLLFAKWFLEDHEPYWERDVAYHAKGAAYKYNRNNPDSPDFLQGGMDTKRTESYLAAASMDPKVGLSQYLEKLRMAKVGSMSEILGVLLYHVRNTKYSRGNNDITKMLSMFPMLLSAMCAFNLRFTVELLLPAYGDDYAVAAAVAHYTRKLQKMVAYRQESECFMAYDENTGVWIAVSVMEMQEIIRDQLESLRMYLLYNPKALEKTMDGVKMYLSAPHFGKSFCGYSFLDAKTGSPMSYIMGVPKPVPACSAFELTTFFGTPEDGDSQFTPLLEDYLRSITYLNPANIHMLRTFVAPMCMGLGSSSHFLYMQGLPGTGKSTFRKFLRHILGQPNVFLCQPTSFSGQFRMVGIPSETKLAVIDDLGTGKDVQPETLLNHLKVHSTESDLYSEKKYANAQHRVHGVRHILCVNQFFFPDSLGDALLRRTIVIQPTRSEMCREVDAIDSEMAATSTTSFVSWLDRTPLLLYRLKTYNAAINFMTESHNLGHSPVGAFILANLSRFFVHKGAIQPITRTKMQSSDNCVEGVYDAYLQQTTGPTVSESLFVAELEELSERVFFLEKALPENSFVRIKRIPRTSSTKATWFQVEYSADEQRRSELVALGASPLEPRLPLRVAVLALLHGRVSDPRIHTSAGESWGLTIHLKYPRIFADTLHALVQEGIPRSVLRQFYSGSQHTQDQVVKIQADLQRTYSFYDGIQKPSFPITLLQTPLSVRTGLMAGSRPPIMPEDPDTEPEHMVPVYSNPITDRDLDRAQEKGAANSGEFVALMVKAAQRSAGSKPADSVILPDTTSAMNVGPFVTRSAFQALQQFYKPLRNLNLPEEFYLGNEMGLQEYHKLNDAISQNAPILRLDSCGNVIGVENSHETVGPLWVQPTQTLSHSETQSEAQCVEPEVEQEAPPAQRTAPPPAPGVVPPAQRTTPGAPGVASPAYRESTINRSNNSIAPAAANAALSKSRPIKPLEKNELLARQEELQSATNLVQTLTLQVDKTDAARAPYLKQRNLSVDQQIAKTAAYADHKAAKTALSNAQRALCAAKGQSAIAAQRDLGLQDIFANELCHHVMVLAKNISLWEGNCLEEGEPAYIQVIPFVTRTLPSNGVVLLTEHLREFGAIYLGSSLDALAVKVAETITKVVIADSRSPDSDAYSRIFMCRDVRTSAYMQALLDHDWGIQNVRAMQWKKGFANSKSNEIMRAHYADFTAFSSAHLELNREVVRPLQIYAAVYGFFKNLKELASANLKFSKTNVLAKTTFFKTMDFSTPFAVKYVGDAQMDSPGRLSIKGTTYTTMPRVFRSEVFPFILKTIVEKKFPKLKLFILDVAGCHAALQACLLPEKTPLLYEVYKNEEKIWDAFSRLCPPSTYLDPEKDRKLMKIPFYASMNGGTVTTIASMRSHLEKTIKPGDPLYPELERVTNILLKHPLMLELKTIHEFWKELAGTMYVPTRHGPISRLSTQAEADKYNKKIKAQGKTYTKEAGSALSHRLPSLYYTSLEVIFMSKIYSYAYEYVRINHSDYPENRIPFALVQGIHDGLLFAVDECVNIVELGVYVNMRLASFSQESIGIALKVDCQLDLTQKDKQDEGTLVETPEQLGEDHDT